LFTENDLKPFQKVAVDFLTDSKLNKILADDPGLGKTPVSVIALKKLRPKKTLIFCPATIKVTWAVRLIEWGFCQADDIYIVNSLSDVIPDKKVTILNYDLIQRKDDTRVLDQLLEWDYGVQIYDEAHALSGWKSRRSNAILGGDKKQIPLSSCGVRKWFLSGSIAPNRTIDLYPIMVTHFQECMSGRITYEGFAKYFCGGYYDQDERAVVAKGATHTEELFENLKAAMLRRRVEDVYPEMPEVLERDIYCEVDCAANEGNTCGPSLRNELSIAKGSFIVNHVRGILEYQDKVVVACFSRVLIASLLHSLAEYGAVVVDGSVSRKNKQRNIQAFIHNPSKRIIIAQINAAGTGLDGLQRVCHHVVHCEPEWSEGIDAQLVGRLKRFGQTKPIYVDRIIAVDTFDQKVTKARLKKKVVLDKLLATNVRIEMSLEQSLERIAVALEKLAGNAPMPGVSTSKAPVDKESDTATDAGNKKPAAGKSTKEVAKKEKELTKDDIATLVSEAVDTLTGIFGDEKKAQAEIKPIIKEHGAEKLKDLKPAVFKDFKAAIDALISEALTGDVGGDDVNEDEDL